MSSARVLLVHSFIIAFVLAPLAVLGGISEGSEGAHPVDLAAILRAWKLRQETVRSLDIQVTGTEFRSKTSISALDIATATRLHDKPIEPSDTSFPVRMRFALDERGRVRLQYEGRTWSPKESDYVQESTIDVFDGSERKTLFAECPAGVPNAHIQAGDTHNVARDARMLPILITYRPFHPPLGIFESGLFRLAEGRGVVDGQECLVLHQGEKTIWVDPSRDFMPARYYQNRRGKLIESIEIRYSKDESNEWVPVAWTRARFYGEENLKESVTVDVSELHVNESIPDEVFDIPLPPGTMVRNYTTNETFILRGNGERRPVPFGEFNEDNYQRLLHDDSLWDRWRWWWLLTVNLLLLLGIVFLLRRFLSRRRIRGRFPRRPHTRTP